MTIDELKEAQRKLAELEHATLEDITAKAKLLGFELVKMNGAPPQATPNKQGKLYRNPENPEEIYRGKGKRPAWLIAKLEAGHDVAEFAVA
jgi:DNA-binding protein H-NS